MGPLIGAADLAAHRGDAGWRIFDCRHDLENPGYGEKAYARGHIPGAVFLHLERDLAGATSGSNGRHPLPAPPVFAARMAACGVGPETQVVAYDHEGGAFAARLWWMLRWLGHTRAAVLDGGLAGWRRAGLPLDIEVPGPAPATLAARPGFKPVTTDEVLARLARRRAVPRRAAPPRGAANAVSVGAAARGHTLMLDARAPERYSGEEENIDPVGGHIPGAVNRHYFDNLDDAGCYFKPAAELRAEFEQILAGRDPADVIQLCGSGVTACHNLLAMELAGLPGSRLYAGSWSEWCTDPSRPGVTG